MTRLTPGWWLTVLLGLSIAAGTAHAQTSTDSTSAPSAMPAADAPPVGVAPDRRAPVMPIDTMRTEAGRPGQTRKVRLKGRTGNVVRTGPGDRFAIVGVYPFGASFPVIAKSGDWYDVRLSDSETGWIHASLCREFDDLSDLEFKPNPKLFSRTGSFIATGYTGAYAFDRKSNSLVLGGRLGYYVFDRLQLEAGVAWTHVKRPAEIVESLFGLTLEEEDFQMLFYHLIATWELMPGRQMVPYVSGGVGSTLMQGETEPSFNLGAGTMLFLSKRLAMRWEVRDYRFQSGADNSRRTNHNVEFALGTAVLF